MLSQSDIIVRPGSLTERLAAAAPPQAEPTPTTMAERFAPEAQKNGGGGGDGPGRPPAEPTVVPGIVPERSRGGSPNRGLLLAAMLVSLVPTAIILVLMWQGAIRMPGSDQNTPIIFDHEQFVDAQQASLAVVPSLQMEPRVEEPKPDIALTAPGRIVAKNGE